MLLMRCLFSLYPSPFLSLSLSVHIAHTINDLINKCRAAQRIRSTRKCAASAFCALLLATFVSFAMHRLILTLNLKCFMQQREHTHTHTQIQLAPTHMSAACEEPTKRSSRRTTTATRRDQQQQQQKDPRVSGPGPGPVPGCMAAVVVLVLHAIISHGIGVFFLLLLHLLAPSNKLSYQVSLMYTRREQPGRGSST